MDRVGVLAAGAGERRLGLRPGVLDVGVGDDGRGRAERVDVRRGAETGPPAEDQQVGQRVAAEPVRAVHAAGALAGREQARARSAAAVSGSTSTPPIT